MFVGTEWCLQTNKAIDKKIRSWQGLVERRYIVNGHPMVKQGWAHGDNVRARGMGMIRVCGRAVDQRRKSARRVGGGGTQRWATRSSVLTSIPATDVSAGRSG